MKTSVITSKMLLEQLISVIAPSYCMVCQKKGAGLCVRCLEEYISPTPSRCYRCHKTTRQHQVCTSCRSSIGLSHVWVVTDYSGVAKDLLHKLKFERASYLAKDIAGMMCDTLPLLPKETIITYAPTAPKRVRVRGYDQSKLIAGHLSKLCNLETGKYFVRLSNTRQLGASRATRFNQAKKSYELKDHSKLKNKQILIVDDVSTSGATIETLAKILKDNGAKKVSAIVFAEAVDD